MAQKHNLTIQVVSIIGGILTAIFFLGFLALARIIQSEISSLIIGTLLIITTLIISRVVIRPFLDAMNITLYIAGCVLAGFGMSANIHALFFILIIISILTFFLSRGFILPFLSVILFNISLFGEVAYVFSSFYPLQIAVIPILGAFLFINAFEKLFEGTETGNYFSKYRPFHAGLFVSSIVSLGGLSISYLVSETNSWLVSGILSVYIWVGLLIMIQQIIQVMKGNNPVNQVGIYILCIIICLPTVFAPYLSGSLLLILICFHYGYRAECAAALLLFIYAVSKYYYDLNLSLLTKSITLFFIGIACIAAWYFFTQKRTRHEKYSRILIIVNLILLLGYFNWSVYKKEQILKDGRLVLLQLVPVDPRSLMQGDYMRLNYQEASSAPVDEQTAKRGYAVLRTDSNQVGEIVRLQNALEPVNSDELVIKYKIVHYRLFLGAESFFFEEGQDTLYQKAMYGGLKVNDKGQNLLVGLYDKDFHRIQSDK